MRFTLPKPLNGWRAFWGEVGIIVLGVLLALGAQQLAEDWQWRSEVADTRAALAVEIAENAGNAIERQMINNCLRPRLSELLKLLNRGDGDWKGTTDRLRYRTYIENFRDFPTVYRSPYMGWPSDVWDAAKANGVVSHMPRDEVTRLSKLYTTFASMRDLQKLEQGLFPSLLNLGFDDRLDPAGRREAIATIGQLHWANQVMLEEADRIPAQLDGLEKTLGKVDLDAEIDARFKKQHNFRGECVAKV